MTEYEYEYYLASQKWSNTNTNIIWPVGHLSSGEKKHHSINVTSCLWHMICRVVVFTQAVLKMAKSKPKKWKWKSFYLNIMFAFAFTFLAEILASSTFFGSSEVTMLTKIYIVFKKKSQRYSVWQITNTNNIRFEKLSEYEYE